MSRPLADSDPFRAIADPTRRRMLDLLRTNGPTSPGELLANFRLSGASLSHHLRILRDVGLITQRRAGRKRLYRLQPQRLRVIRRWLESQRPA